MKNISYLINIYSVSDYVDMDVQQLVEKFNTTQDEEYLKGLIHNIGPLIISIGKTFPTLDGDYKSSTALERLTIALQSYESGKGKFTTYFTWIYKRALIDEYNRLVRMQKNLNENNMEIVSLDSIEEYGFTLQTSDERFSLQSFLDLCELTDLHAHIVTLLFEGYSIRQVTNKLQLTRTQIDKAMLHIRNNVKQSYGRDLTHFLNINV